MDNDLLSRALTLFAPNSAGSQDQLIDHSLRAIVELPRAVSAFFDVDFASSTTSDEFSTECPQEPIRVLGETLARHRSDKSTIHDYHKLYATLFHSQRRSPKLLVEIGIGTNNPSLVSTMGPTGRPGASLRAWADCFPQADVIGADIDREILFNEGNIRCVQCDQTSEDGFAAVDSCIDGRPVDLLIDDGLHSVHANLNTLRFGMRNVRPGGHVVVEDIPVRLAWFWMLMAGMLGKRHACSLVRCRSAYCFVVKM